MPSNSPTSPEAHDEAHDAPPPIIRVQNLHKRFGPHIVQRGITVDIAAGSIHFVIGASGVGKSVLIKEMVGLLTPDQGTITILGQDTSGLDEPGWESLRQKCQFIFQKPSLLSSLTVLENLAMPLRHRFRLSRAEAKSQAQDALKALRLERWTDHAPETLGPGVQKEITIARAAALDPKIMLFDEPTTSLDAQAARRMTRFIADLVHERGMSAVVVSHDLEAVAAIADVVTFLYKGKVAFEGSPEALFASKIPEVQRFVHGQTKRWKPPVSSAAL